MSGFFSRHSFQAATPSLSNATCSSFATEAPPAWIVVRPLIPIFLRLPLHLLTRLLLLSSLLEQIIQSRIDPSLINVAPERAIGSNDPISPVFPHYLDAVNGGPFPSVSRWNERKVR